MKREPYITIALGLIGGLIVSAWSLLGGILFFLGAGLSVISICGYTEICRAVLGQGGSILIGANLVIAKLAFLVFLIVKIIKNEPTYALWLILGLFTFLPVVLCGAREKEE